jgi:LGFP repeat/PAN domain
MSLSAALLRATGLVSLLTSLLLSGAPALAVGDYGPETCKEGFVWREACGPDDHVCVVPARRTQAAADNAAAMSRRQPGGGAYGPDTCKQGFVWREACGPEDHVCVPAQTRTDAAQDNSQKTARFKQNIPLWDVLTQHVDAARTGAQLHETHLTPANVKANSFGKLYERQVDGQIIAQPLYLSNQWSDTKGLKNVVYVATRANTIYAFDADDTDPDPTHGLIWSHPITVDPAAPVPGMCSETVGPVGITATPVIDRDADTMYVVSRKSDGSIWLHALDIGTGQPKAGTPGAVKIMAALNGITFNQSLELSRAGLLLANGAIYVGFSALNCDNAGWHGWVLAYRAPDLTQVGAFVTTSSGGWGGGVWASGRGIVGDGHGGIYFQTGNGSVTGNTDLGQSFVKLNAGAPPFYGVTLGGHYALSNWNGLNFGDTDLGSSGPLLMPGNRLVGGGKQGKLYVLNTQTMQPSQNGPAGGPVPVGGSDGFQAFVNSWHDDASQPACMYPHTVLETHCYLAHPRYEESELTGPNLHSGPVYWNGRLYAMPEKDHLRAFAYNSGTGALSTTAASVSADRSPDGMPGAALSLSANGNSSGILWASIPLYDGQWQNVPGILVAFDAMSLNEIWRDDDPIGFAKFNPPTIGGGKVFRPTFADKLIVYGEKSGATPASCFTVAQVYQNFTSENGLLGNASGPEATAPDGVGRFRDFAGGVVYWSLGTCGHEVHGAISGEWNATGLSAGFLGYPTTNEQVTPDGIGRYNHFQNGSIYWTPLTGAHEVHGAIRGQWSSMGWEQSVLGYPITDETDEIDGSGRFNLFEHGAIHWRRADGTITVQSDANMLLAIAQQGTDRPGQDIANFVPPEANPAMCAESCAGNASCKAWTYVAPNTTQGPQPHCWIKSGIPLPAPNACCASAVKIQVHPAGMTAMQGAFDRPGDDFANFDLAAPDARLCQGECAINGTCQAWAYVAPGGNQPNPHCWLKSTIPGPVANECCSAGAK